MGNSRVIFNLAEQDPWFGLAAAIVLRAVEDARGNCVYNEPIVVAKVQQEAQNFLHGNDILYLISEVAGVDEQYALQALLQRTHNG